MRSFDAIRHLDEIEQALRNSRIDVVELLVFAESQLLFQHHPQLPSDMVAPVDEGPRHMSGQTDRASLECRVPKPTAGYVCGACIYQKIVNVLAPVLTIRCCRVARIHDKLANSVSK